MQGWVIYLVYVEGISSLTHCDNAKSRQISPSYYAVQNVNTGFTLEKSKISALRINYSNSVNLYALTH